MNIPRTPPADTISLSPLQEGVWFTEQLGSAESAYHLALTVTFAGQVDIGALVAACEAVVERHPMLASAVREFDGAPTLVPATVLPSPVVEDRPADQGWWQNRVRAEVLRPFDLGTGPLVRFVIVRTAPVQVRLLIVAHHLVFDGESKDIVLRDLADVYNGRDLAEPAEQAPPTGDQAAARKFWASRWHPPAPVILPGLLASHVRSGDGRAVDVCLDPGLDSAISATARACGLTRFELLLAALQALILRYGNEQAVVTVAMSTRDKATGETVGLFANELPVTAQPAPGRTFREFATAIREQLREIYRFRAVPLARAVHGLNPGTALTTVSLSYRAAGEEPRFDGLTIEVDRSVFNHTSGNALHVHVVDGPRGIAISFRYGTGALSRADVTRIAGHLRELLTAITANPDEHVDQIAILTTAERHRILVEWNATATASPAVATVHELVEAQVAKTPDAEAIVFADRRASYAELNEQANRLAHWLRERGAGRDRLIAVCVERSPELLVALLAVLKTGAGYIPLDPEHPDERLAALLRDANPMLVLAQERLAARLAAGGISTVHVDRPDPWQEQPATNPAVAVDPGDVVNVIYTSGSTGRPKAVPNTHRGVCNTLTWMQQIHALDGADAVAQHTSVAFDVSGLELFWPLLAGARVVQAEPGGRRDPRSLRDLIVEHGVTTLQLVPSMLGPFLETEGIGACTSLRRTISCGEQLPPRLVGNFFHLLPGELHNTYGPAEAAITAAARVCQLADGQSAVVSVGRPIPNARLYLLDPNLQPVPVGVPGEIHIAGAGLARGYHNEPGKTASRFIPDPFGPPGSRLYRTGDLGRYRPDGNIDVIGRTDHQVKVRGVRVEPGEIESLLRHQFGVRDAVVVVDADNPGGAALAAYLVPDGGAEIDAAALREVASRTLPDAMRPASYTVLDTFPLTPNGKIDRAALPRPRRETAAPAPSTTDPVTEGIRAIWCTVLGLEHIDPDANLFELGGHSLTVTKIAVTMRRTLGIDLPLNVFYDTPTITALARAAAAGEGATP